MFSIKEHELLLLTILLAILVISSVIPSLFIGHDLIMNMNIGFVFIATFLSRICKALEKE